MIVGVAKETVPGERRVALVPELVAKLTKAGLEVRVQPGAGLAAGFADAAYQEQGARLEADLSAADILPKVQPPNMRSAIPPWLRNAFPLPKGRSYVPLM